MRDDEGSKRVPRPIAGYLRVYRRWQAAKARLDKKMDALNPLRRTVAELHDQIKVREGRLTGGQWGAVRRILHVPSPMLGQEITWAESKRISVDGP